MVISILKSVLAAGAARVALVYANRDERSVIFSELRLRRLAAAGRRTACVVVHWLDLGTGDPRMAAGIAGPGPAVCRVGEPYACGPDLYLTVVRAARFRAARRARQAWVRSERFLSLAENPFDEPPFDEPRAACRAGGGCRRRRCRSRLDGTATSFKLLASRQQSGMLDVLISAGRAAFLLVPPGNLRRLRLPAGGFSMRWRWRTTRYLRRRTWPMATSSPARPCR